MTHDEQYCHFVDAIEQAIEEAMEAIPGDEIEGAALHAALGYVATTVAQASSDPEHMMFEFLERAAHAFVELQDEEDPHV